MSDKNLYENEDPIWRTHMQILMKKKRNLEIAQIINDSLTEYYQEQGKPVPDWKVSKDPQWWKEYLIDNGLDPSNP